LGQRNSAFANCHGLGLPRERKTPLLKATFCPFGSRLNPSLIKIDDKIVTRPLRLPQGRRLPGYERELLQGYAALRLAWKCVPPFSQRVTDRI
jgi:hypothetical protein